MPAEVRIDIFPNDFVIFCHLDEPAAGAFGDQRVAVGKPLGAADKRAVKPVGVRGHDIPCLLGRVLPYNFQ